MDNTALPLGFGMALAQNEEAMNRFESMTEAEKQEVIRRTHQVTSKREMQRLVAELPIPSDVYPAIDTDLARDNLQNDIPAADLSEL